MLSRMKWVTSTLGVTLTSTIGSGVVMLFAVPPFDGYEYCASQSQGKCGNDFEECISGYCFGYCSAYPEDPDCLDDCITLGMKYCS